MARATSLFKYRDFSKNSIELLLNRELWFAQPETLNDPFECQLEYLRILKGTWQKSDLSKMDKKLITKSIERILEEVGICSFSRTRKNQLMWAHYANEHYGFCIGFNEKLLQNSNPTIRAIDVEYQSALPTMELIKHLDSIGFKQYNGSAENIATAILETIIGTKYTNWSYEKERRLIQPKYGAIKFQPKAIVSIAFGLRMTTRDKKTLKSLLKENEWNHIKWFQAEKSDKKYALEFKQVAV